MAERKFSALAGIKKQKEPDLPAVPVASAIEPPMVKGRGRPAGKRSDPAYEPTTLLLRKATKKTAFRLLEDTAAGLDLSDLAEQLIADWVRQRQA
jgi:hypothetical protein